MWDDVDRQARRQHGLITRGQLLEAGFSEAAIRWSEAEGRLKRVRSAVYCMAGVPPSQEQAWLAAVFAARGDAVLSHASAA
ncbi:MAG TPA: type IV toxin-antitoxin system AbiEi family antitoxin domain-containing protein, partial [Acidimicrobiia bacterium]|nr:type IV toxin-antitoxin system AbiEi family antitoxin domain-containing protein [Acidimicrobiia bacterium]